MYDYVASNIVSSEQSRSTIVKGNWLVQIFQRDILSDGHLDHHRHKQLQKTLKNCKNILHNEDTLGCY